MRETQQGLQDVAQILREAGWDRGASPAGENHVGESPETIRRVLKIHFAETEHAQASLYAEYVAYTTDMKSAGKHIASQRLRPTSTASSRAVAASSTSSPLPPHIPSASNSSATRSKHFAHTTPAPSDQLRRSTS